MEKLFVDRLYGKNMKEDAKTNTRGELQKMMAAVQEGDVIVVESISRIGRTPRVIFPFITELKCKGAEFVSIKEAIDTTTPYGRFFTAVCEKWYAGEITTVAAVEELKKGKNTFGEGEKTAHEEGGGMIGSTIDRKDCPMRHENGNCTVAGGFCTAVNDPICEALHNAFRCGEDAERDRMVLMFADMNVKYEQKKLKEIKKVLEKVTAPMEELQAELGRYKKAEAEGRLLWIPFVEGDIVYFIDIHSSGEDLGKRYLRSGKVTRVSLAGMYVCVNTSTLPLSLPFESVYSTEEEAKETMEKKYGKNEEA